MRPLLFRVCVVVGVVVMAWAATAGAQEPGRLRVFLSFEEEQELAGLKAGDGVRLSRSTRYSTWRENSLEAVFPAAGGQIEVSDIPTDWRWRGAMLLFAWSEQPSELDVVLEDSSGNRHRQSFGLN